MMNKRFILLLVFCVHLASSAEILAKRANAAEKEKYAEKLNSLRHAYAGKNNVGNMHELIYDSGLEKIAKEMSKGCSFGHGNYVLISEEQMLEKSEEIFHPLQTQFACIDLMTPCPERRIEKGFCLIGPHSDGFSEELFKTGPLGSHCDGKVAANGLCTTGSGASKTPEGSRLHGLEVELNLARVLHAKKENIGNMHELTYDHELEKLAKSMAKDCQFPHGPYTLVSKDIDPETNKEKLTHPLQTKVACVEEAQCPHRGLEHSFCLLGPYSSQSTEEDVKTGPLGSHCENGVADNGLCKAK